MKKRQLAIIPLLIASIVMLVSTALPHHHHGELICFSETHCIQQETGKTCQHDHSSKSCEKGCEVKSLFETDIIKEHHHECSCCPDLTPDLQFLPLFIIAGEINLTLFSGETRILPPNYQECLHPITWSVTTAGRAPPVAIA